MIIINLVFLIIVRAINRTIICSIWACCSQCIWNTSFAVDKNDHKFSSWINGYVKLDLSDLILRMERMFISTNALYQLEHLWLSLFPRVIGSWKKSRRPSTFSCFSFLYLFLDLSSFETQSCSVRCNADGSLCLVRGICDYNQTRAPYP